MIHLCGAKGKDDTRNNAELNIKKEEMDKLNAAKKAGKTGMFILTFSVEGGKEAKVTVTLTGEHRVSFNPNGGDYTPKTQTVVGGKNAVEPKEPKREGYAFEGWYDKGEDGKERLWDFDTPVHRSMELKAKWEKEPEEVTSSETPQKNGKSTSEKKKDGYYWKSEDITKNYESNRSVAKTGDTSHMGILILMTAACGGILFILYNRRRD